MDRTAWTIRTMPCMYKSSSQAGSKASMSSVSSKMLCQSNPSKSMNLGTEDIWMAAALHKVFAVSDQPKANTLLTWAAHPCQEVDTIPHPYPSMPCSALWLLAVVEVRPSKASSAWAFHLQGPVIDRLQHDMPSVRVIGNYPVCLIASANCLARQGEVIVSGKSSPRSVAAWLLLDIRPCSSNLKSTLQTVQTIVYTRCANWTTSCSCHLDRMQQRLCWLLEHVYVCTDTHF